MPQISLRPCTADDLPLLLQVYFDTREEELRQVPWTDEQKWQFVQSQFAAQHQDYHEKNPDASYDVILADGQPAGRLYVDRRPHEIQIIDIALLTRLRGQGIGGQLMADLLAEGAAANKPVRIYVDQRGRALRLYERLGFREIGEVGIYLHMEWLPDSAETSDPDGLEPSGKADHGKAESP